MSSPRCWNCDAEFEKKQKGYHRQSVLSLSSPRTLKKVFPNVTSIDESSYICPNCIRVLRSKTVKKGKKRTWAATNTKLKGPAAAKRRRTSLETKKGRPAGRGPRATIFGLMMARNYVGALRKLIELPCGKFAFFKLCREMILEERKVLLSDKDGPYHMKFSPENLASFAWRDTTEWISGKAPLMKTCLQSMFPQPKKIKGQHLVKNTEHTTGKRQMTEEEAKCVIEKRIGTVVSMALYTCSNKINFVQAALGTEMWRQGCPLPMFSTLNSLGVSQSKNASRGHVDKIRTEGDVEVKKWKEEVEKQPRRRRLFQRHSRGNTYSLIWDNVQMHPHSKHQSLEKGKVFPSWAFRFAHRNRVNFRHLQGPALKAVEVPPKNVLPSEQTYESLRQRMISLVMRILADNLLALKGPRRKVERHIPHMYSVNTQEKSTVISLGVVSDNPSTNAGVLNIMDGFAQYVPRVDGKPYPILCGGDGVSVERMTCCRRTRANGATPDLRFEGLVEAPQEFHKEFIAFQDMMDMLLSQRSEGVRGTLAQIRDFFKYKPMKKEVKNNIQHVWDFISFVVMALVTLCAIKLCDINTVEDRPVDYPTEATAQMEWLRKMAQTIVDMVWMPPAMEDIRIAAVVAARPESGEQGRFPFCFCGEDLKEEVMVQCCSNLCGGVWFHKKCATIDAPLRPEADWFCSPECQDSGSYVYCYCKQQLGGLMVQCTRMDQCKGHEWYHEQCLNEVDRDQARLGSWYCSESCTNSSDQEDHVLNYTKAVVWEGLFNMARRDAVREGDGEAISAFWKMDMVKFWDRMHPKNFIIAHQLLTGIEGFHPECIRQDLKWNRVANLQGRPGGNIGLDQLNEFLNNEFKEMLQRSRGQHTDKQVDRCAQMSGLFGKDLRRLFISSGIGTCNLQSLSSSTPSSARIQKDISVFIQEYKKDRLFDYVPGRKHKGFEKFTYPQRIREPRKMGVTMRTLAEEMDSWRDLATG